MAFDLSMLLFISHKLKIVCDIVRDLKIIPKGQKITFYVHLYNTSMRELKDKRLTEEESKELSEVQKEELRGEFFLLDKERDGTITGKQLVKVIRSLGNIYHWWTDGGDL